jgi:hypothetical protein
VYTLSQLRSRVRNLLAEAQADFYTDSQIDRWINDGVEELWKTLRTEKEDLFVKVLKSTDSSVFILDRTFDPSTLRITSGVVSYTLPPDFIQLKYIRPISSSYSFTRFYPTDVASNIFDYLAASSVRGSTAFVYDIVGRDLVIAPQPSISIDIELGYVYRISPLRQYDNSGTISVSAGSTTVTGTGTKFTRLKDGMRIVPGTVDTTKIYPYIVGNPSSDTSLIISGKLSDDAISNSTYVVEDGLPEVMMDYSRLIVDFALMCAYQKDRSHSSFKEAYELFQKGEAKTKESGSDSKAGADMVDPYIEG